MDYDVLSPEVKKPEYSGKTPQQIADILNAMTATKPDPGRKSLLSVIEKLDDAGTIITKLDAVAVSNAVLKEGLAAARSYQPDSGIDFTHPRTVAMFDTLVASSVLTQAEADGLKSVGTQPCTLADSLGLSFVHPGHVESALAMP
tara:strand:+ start:48 stop:482 length:435 start_codon:yes stop_codon:yes gene_type:complete